MIRLFAEVSFEKPALIGWIGGWVGVIGALTIERATQWVALIGGIFTCVSVLAAIVYTSIRTYYLIKNKGKEK